MSTINFNTTEFKEMLTTFSDVELNDYKEHLKSMLVNMIANPHIGKQLTLVELEIIKRKQVQE